MTFRRLIITTVIFLAAGLFLFRGPENEALSKAVSTEEIPILMYHKVSPYTVHGGLGLRVDPRAFRKQMQYLYDQGYHPISLDQMMEYREEKVPLPSRPIIITFDDGYEDNFNFAFPVLQKFGFTATIFLVYDDIGGYNIWDDNKNVAHNIKLLSWQQIDVMKNQAISFESHTLTHPNLTELSLEDLQREIAGSKRKLAERLGKEVNFIAYPYGYRNPEVDEAARSAGYKGAVTTELGKNTEYTDPVQLKRLRVNGYTTIKDFEEMLTE